MEKAWLQIFTAILVLGLFCGAATAAPSIINTIPAGNSTITGIVGQNQTFSIQANESIEDDVEWSVNGDPVSETSYDAGSNSSILSHSIQQGNTRLEQQFNQTEIMRL